MILHKATTTMSRSGSSCQPTPTLYRLEIIIPELIFTNTISETGVESDTWSDLGIEGHRNPWSKSGSMSEHWSITGSLQLLCSESQ